MTIGRVAIIGAGTMGQGIAQVCAAAGFTVQLFDANISVVEKAISRIAAGLDTLISKGKINEETRTNILRSISPVSKLDDVKADFIIEAIVESLVPKQELMKSLERLNPEAILASNTSTFPIGDIASVLVNPANCIGLHFFNPAPVMKLVEIVCSNKTSSSAIETTRAFADKLNKTSVLTKDSPGFIVNRVARHFYVESLKILEEGESSVETIDKLMRSSGFKMGPFELIDTIGMDVNLAVTTSMYHAFHEHPKFTPSRIQEEKVNAGHLGKKSGKGFYDY